MKTLLCFSAACLLAAGCASDPGAQYARAECKVAPITTSGSVHAGKSRPVNSLEQRYAEMQLASTQYRRDNLARNGPYPNNVEEALRDCY
jgi:hypothetical protein